MQNARCAMLNDKFKGHTLITATFLLMSLAASAVAGIELQDSASRAYDAYVEQAKRDFLARTKSVAVKSDDPADVRAARGGPVVARPGSQDGIISVAGGLVHHWFAATFIDRVALRQALAVSSAYARYPSIYTSIVAARVLGADGASTRVLFRIRESAGTVRATLDVRSNVQYFYPNSRQAYAISTSEDIREVKNPGRADEHLLPAGNDSGYLWRAGTHTSLLERDNGVYVEMESFGLSRQFPPLLGWIIEPIARRLGRKSVATSLEEFRRAVLAER